MTADPRLLPPGIADDRARAVLELIERIGSIDLTPLLTARIDSVEAGALIHLAAQFHVLGLEGYDLASDDAAKRALIRQAITLHRTKGTPYAVKQALTRAGYPNVSIDETVGRRRRNGQYRRNGEIRHAGEPGWASFRVSFDGLDDVAVTPELTALLSGLIAEWKNARSHLESLSFAHTLNDVVARPVDSPMLLLLHTAAYADGFYVADGSVNGRGEFDIIEAVA